MTIPLPLGEPSIRPHQEVPGLFMRGTSWCNLRTRRWQRHHQGTSNLFPELPATPPPNSLDSWLITRLSKLLLHLLQKVKIISRIQSSSKWTCNAPNQRGGIFHIQQQQVHAVQSPKCLYIIVKFLIIFHSCVPWGVNYSQPFVNIVDYLPHDIIIVDDLNLSLPFAGDLLLVLTSRIGKDLDFT